MNRLMHAVVCCVLFAGSARAQTELPLVDDVDAKTLQTHIKNLILGLEKHKAALSEDALKQLRPLLDKELAAGTANAIQKLLDPHCLMGVSINPESRVKAVRGPGSVALRQNQTTLVLVKIHNEAGVTASLAVTGPQLAESGKGGGEQWLEAEVVAAAPFTGKLSGRNVEYVALKLTARATGKREATFKFDVGQGTQDLGYRAEVPILFAIVK